MGDSNSMVNIGTSQFSSEDGWRLMTMFDDGERVLEALRAGDIIFLIKSGNSNQLPKFIGGGQDGVTITPSIEGQVMKHFHLIRISSGKLKGLSPREEEVLELIAAGFYFREVGEKIK